jgi:hypothetical protein
VGVDAATLFPDCTVPVARAGSDQTILDANGDGFEMVSLDASASHDPDGSINTYTWSIGGKTLFTSSLPQATLSLPEGDHYVRLVVTDNTGKSDSDAVRIRIVAPAPGENVLSCPGFEESSCPWSVGPGAVVTSAPTEVHSGARALRLTQNGALQRFSQVVPVSPGVYTVSGWLRTASLVPYAVSPPASWLRTARSWRAGSSASSAATHPTRTIRPRSRWPPTSRPSSWQGPWRARAPDGHTSTTCGSAIATCSATAGSRSAPPPVAAGTCPAGRSPAEEKSLTSRTTRAAVSAP